MPPRVPVSARLRGLSAGPLPVWPEVVDALAERWFGLAPRMRLAAACLVVALAGLTATGVAARSPWGPDIHVLVAARAVPAGATLTAGDLVPAARPQRTVPAAAVAATTRWVGAVTTGPLPAGGVVTSAQVSDDGLAGVVAPGRVAVAVARGSLPPLRPGQRVDLLGGDGDLGGQHLARDGRVLAADDAHVWIEVDRRDAGAVAAALAWGTVTVALLGR